MSGEYSADRLHSLFSVPPPRLLVEVPAPVTFVEVAEAERRLWAGVHVGVVHVGPPRIVGPLPGHEGDGDAS